MNFTIGCFLFFMIGCQNANSIEPTKSLKIPDGLPQNSYKYIPTLNTEANTYWSGFTGKSYLAAQVEQETCYSLTSPSCWTPTKELKTDREYGFGLGQITVTPKFNNFEEAKKLHPTLSDWRWEERYDPVKQLRTMVLMDKNLFSRVNWTTNDYNRLAFTLASYNGGFGGIVNDRELCRTVQGCDYTKWFNNVEKTSWKSKVKVTGYGRSFYEINREYVTNIMTIRNKKYNFLDN